MTVPRNVTLRPKYTSPVTVKWSSSKILGIFLNLFWNCWIYLSPSLVPGLHSKKKKGAYADLLEVVTQFDDGGRLEHALLVDDELAMLERIDIALDEQQIGAALYGQETLARNIDTVGVLEVLDGSTSGGLELDNCVAIVCGLVVDDDLELETFRFHDALEGWKYGLGHGSEYYIGPSSRIPFKLIHKLLVLKILNFRTRKGLNMKKRRKKTTVGAYQI